MTAASFVLSGGGVDVEAIEALLRAVWWHCEGTSGTAAQKMPVPPAVTGYFWPDDEFPEVGTGGRSPLGVVVRRVRAEVDGCQFLASDERDLLLRKYGLCGAVTRVDAADRSSSLARRLGPAVASGRVGRASGVSQRLGGAHEQLARTLRARPCATVTVPCWQRDPLQESWIRRLGFDRDAMRRLVDAAHREALRWCEVGGIRQMQLWAALDGWYARHAGGSWPAEMRNARRMKQRANAYIAIALYRVVGQPGFVERCRQGVSWTRHMPSAHRLLAVGPIEPCRAPAALTDPLLCQARPATDELLELATWMQRAMRDGTPVVADAQLLDLVASRMLDLLSERAVGVVVRTLTDAGAHHDVLAGMADRWLQVSIDRNLRFPDWLTAVVNTSVASSAMGWFGYAEQVLVDAMPLVKAWEPPPGMRGEVDVEIERLEQVQQLWVGRAAWRRRAAQRIITDGGDPRTFRLLIGKAIDQGRDAVRAASTLTGYAHQGRPTNATGGWVLGAVLRVHEPMAVACYADSHLGRDLRLEPDQRDKFARFRRQMRDYVAAAQALPTIGNDGTTRARLVTVADLDARIADGDGLLTMSVRGRIRAAAK